MMGDQANERNKRWHQMIHSNKLSNFNQISFFYFFVAPINIVKYTTSWGFLTFTVQTEPLQTCKQISANRGSISSLMLEMLNLTPETNNNNKFSSKVTELCKFDPEGSCGPIPKIDLFLWPWGRGRHASVKKFVVLTSPVFDYSASWYLDIDGSHLNYHI